MFVLRQRLGILQSLVLGCFTPLDGERNRLGYPASPAARKVRKGLSADALLRLLRNGFEGIEDPRSDCAPISLSVGVVGKATFAFRSLCVSVDAAPLRSHAA